MTVMIEVRVTPRGGRDAVEGADAEGALRVRVRAAPADGGANAAVRRLLAAELAVPPSAVTIVRGASARRKLVRVEGPDATRVEALWPGVRVSPPR